MFKTKLNIWHTAGIALAMASALVAHPALAKEKEIAVVVKVTGIPWYNRFAEGVERAGKELHVHAYQVGPTQADPAQQVKIIEDLIAKGVDAIAVTPNDAQSIAPVLQRARDKGIVVITHESPGQKGADWDLETIDNREFAISVFDRLGQLTGGEGKFALYVGTLTMPLHKEWADIGLEYLKQKYPHLQLIADRYPVGENLNDSYQTALQILKANPDIKGFLAFGSQGPIGFARALQQQGFKPGQVAVVGNVLPKQASPYIKRGYINEGFLWDPSDAGYGVVALANQLLDKKPIKDGQSLPGLGKGKIEDHVIRFQASKTFTAANVGKYNF